MPPANTALIAELAAIEAAGGDGDVRVGRARLHVSSLSKCYFPEAGVTKGELLRYYAGVAPVLLPLLRDRPLVLQRYPEGVGGTSFYQQRAPEHAPPGVRVMDVRTTEGDLAPRVVGGALITLLWLAQLGVIAMHPWLARVRRPDALDFAVLDLDPGDGVPFARVQEVALLVRDALAERRLGGAVKTSGSRGLHVFVPLRAGTSEAAARELAQRIAERVAERSPRVATVARSVKARPPGTVYVDYLQNAVGKSVACAYSVRPRPGATVSTPLRWAELDSPLDPGAFTVRSLPGRLAAVGDVWAEELRGARTG